MNKEPITEKRDKVYANYVLFIMLFVYLFNYIDRQILSVLAEDIKADLALSDGDIGFLYGTAFAVFFAIFGIPLARLADSWKRTKLISIGLGTWSVMTVLSGMAKNFSFLAVCRFGVGVGEASATPSAHSLLYDYFPPKIRTTVLAIYSCGGPIGAGLGLILGGVVLDYWNQVYYDHNLAPFGLKGWQAAFLLVGLPGIFLARLVATLKEPERGSEDGLKTVNYKPDNPLLVLKTELLPLIPILNLWNLKRLGSSKKLIHYNLFIMIFLLVITLYLTKWTGNAMHWIALASGLYCAFSWVQSLYCRDMVCFNMIFKCQTIKNLYISSALSIFTAFSFSLWMVPYYQRSFSSTASDAGTIVGVSTAVAGLIGLLMGGWLSDKLRHRLQKGKLIVAFSAGICWMISVVIMLLTTNIWIAYAAGFMYLLFLPMSQIPVSSTINDLALPRVRAVAQALYIMILTIIGAALGPYGVGLLSDLISFFLQVDYSVSLPRAMLISVVLHAIGIFFLYKAFSTIVGDEDSRIEKARSLGEPI